jgi:hypothetical protein
MNEENKINKKSRMAIKSGMTERKKITAYSCREVFETAVSVLTC